MRSPNSRCYSWWCHRSPIVRSSWTHSIDQRDSYRRLKLLLLWLRSFTDQEDSLDGYWAVIGCRRLMAVFWPKYYCLFFLYFHKSKAFWALGLLQSPSQLCSGKFQSGGRRVWEEGEAMSMAAGMQCRCKGLPWLARHTVLDGYGAAATGARFLWVQSWGNNLTGPSGLYPPTSVFSILPPALQAQTCLVPCCLFESFSTVCFPHRSLPNAPEISSPRGEPWLLCVYVLNIFLLTLLNILDHAPHHTNGSVTCALSLHSVLWVPF